MHTDFLGNTLSVGDIVVTSFSQPWGNSDLYEYCKVERFTQKAVIINRLKLKEDSRARTKRVSAHHLIKVDPAHYTMYILKQSKENV